MRLYLSRMEQSVLVVLLLAILGALFVISFAYGRRQRENTETPFLEAAAVPDVTSPAPDAPADRIVVHITGAVKCPGVYRFGPDARVDDAIRQAGGARADGYPDGLNLAASLADGQRICVPTRAEWQQLTATVQPPLVVTGAPDPLHAEPAKGAVKEPKPAAKPKDTPTTPANTGPKPLPEKKVNLNTATPEELTTLPGIGPVSAQRIIDYRKGEKFTDLAQLLNVPGIGPKTYEKLVPYIEL
ncbi:MAG: helix-hairpin-helix domain-containing protein [Armatimonadota bacterium]